VTALRKICAEPGWRGVVCLKNMRVWRIAGRLCPVRFRQIRKIHTKTKYCG
jgi:hypothetical protein